MSTVLFCTWIPNRTSARTQLSVQSGFQWMLTMGFLIVFKGTEQVESNPENTSLVSQHPGAELRLNRAPHDKAPIQQHQAGTSPSHGLLFIFGFAPSTPRKKGSLIKRESAHSALHIIDLLYIINFGYCLCQNLPMHFCFQESLQLHY